MPKSVLVIETDDQGLFFLSLAGGTMSVGDNPGRAEALLRDLPITRIRCEIEVDSDAVVVSRPPSATGQPGVQRELHAGQVLRLAHSRLHIEPASDEQTQSAAPPTPAAVAAPAAKPASGVLEGTFRRLRVVDGADLGRAFRLPQIGSVAIGKSAKHADVVLHDLYVSRVHCVIEAEEGRLVVQHKEGDSGTLVNGVRITAPQELRLGDVLRVGNSHLRLETAHTLDNSPEKEEEEEGELNTRDESEEREASSDPPHELVGKVLGHYRIVQLLGQGHSGEVFRAQDLRNNLMVALKVLSSSFPANGEELQKFVQVMKAVTQQHHPNLVTVQTAGRSGANCWIVREYVEGESAVMTVKRLAERKKANWTRACRIAVHLARALNFLHKQRIVHGNITLANILMGDDKTTKLADLMLASALEGSRLQEAFLEKKVLAELPYLAPEQTYPDAFVDHLADLYGLGAVVYTLLTGRPPFSGETLEELIEEVRQSPVDRPTMHQKGIPAEFEAVVLKLLAKHQEDRYQTAGEFLGSVQAIAEKHNVEA